MPLPRKKTWALVMNATRARILRDLHPPPGSLSTELVLKSEAHHLRDLMTDRPGRSFSSGSVGRRSAIEYRSDPIEEDERDFARQVLSLLDTHRRSGDFDELAVYAEHDVLGLIRKEMSESLRQCVVRELPKNLVHLPPHELPSVILHDMGHSNRTA